MKYLATLAFIVLSGLCHAQTAQVSVPVTGTTTSNWGITAAAYKCNSCAFIQTCNKQGNGATSFCTITVGAGHHLAVGFMTCYNASFCNTTSGDGATIADGFGLTWTVDAQNGFVAGGAGYPFYHGGNAGTLHQAGLGKIWSANTGVNSGSVTITVTRGASTAVSQTMVVAEFSGIPAVTPMDGVEMIGTCSAGDCPNVNGDLLSTNSTPLTQTDLIFAMYQNGDGSAPTPLIPSGFTQIFGASIQSASYKIVTVVPHAARNRGQIY